MDKQTELEQAFKNLSRNELEAVLDALTLVAGQYEMDQADKGIYLKAPYGELIASGEMKCFAKPRRDERLVGPRILLSDHKAFGVMRVGEPVIVGVGEFDELIGDHCIGRKERLQWWPEREELWLYPIEEWKGYEAPIEVDLPPGVQGYVEEVKGGPGSGWHGPPRGTHGEGQETQSTNVVDDITSHLANEFGKLPLQEMEDASWIAPDGSPIGLGADHQESASSALDSVGVGYDSGEDATDKLIEQFGFIRQNYGDEWAVQIGDSITPSQWTRLGYMRTHAARNVPITWEFGDDWGSNWEELRDRVLLRFEMQDREGRKDGSFLQVSLASTPLQAQKGFSNRASIDPSEGLLIPISSEVGIWMKDTSVPLSVAFLDSDYKVLQIDSLTPNDETVHMGPDGSAWALEASPEWFKSVEMEVGDRVVGLKGGPGSGNRGHRGRPNLVGGSAPSGGPIAGGSLVTEPGSTDLRWRNEESVQGSIVIEMPSGVSASEASEGDLVDFIKTNIPQSEVRRIALLGLNDPISIEEVEITSREDRGDFVVLEVDILPSEEAAEEFFAGTIPFEQPERL